MYIMSVYIIYVNMCVYYICEYVIYVCMRIHIDPCTHAHILYNAFVHIQIPVHTQKY